MNKTIVLTGGGTAGHVNPNIALLPFLKCEFDNIYYIGSKDGIEKQLISKCDIPYFAVTTVKLRRSLSPKNLQIPFLLYKGIKESQQILEELKPDIIFSKGGFVSVPVLKASDKLKIPYIIHESDFSMGLANKLCAKKARYVLTSFSNTAKNIKNGIFCGTPIRDSILSGDSKKAKEFLQFSNQKPTILFMGGSLGSKKINETLSKCLYTLAKNYNIVHITGNNNKQMLKHEGYRQIEYTDSIQDLFAISDLVVCRSGSNTINELLAIKKPMLLIPLSKKASRGDQIENANVFMQDGFAHVLYEEQLTPENLVQNINSAFNCRHIMIKNMTTYKKPNGVKNVIEMIKKQL